MKIQLEINEQTGIVEVKSDKQLNPIDILKIINKSSLSIINSLQSVKKPKQQILTQDKNIIK